MATAHISYTGELRTQCTHTKSGTTIITDAPTDNHGKGEAFSPTDLLSSSLVSCMLTLMGITADAHNIAFTKAEASMKKVMSTEPRRVSEIHIDIHVTGDFTDEEKRRLETAARNCPVAKSVHPDIEQHITFVYAS